MDIISLKTLIAIVELGGVSNASQCLGTVQSNVTARIKKLEKELDVKVFYISGRRLNLTLAGKILYDYAKKIVDIELEAISDIRRFKGASAITIGLPATFPYANIPKSLDALRNNHSNLHTEIFTGSSSEVMASLYTGKVDCALLFQDRCPSNIKSIDIYNDRIVLIKPRYHGYSPTLLLQGNDCAYRDIILNWHNSHSTRNNQVIELTNPDVLLDCVSSGLGYTIYSEQQLEDSAKRDMLEVCISDFTPIKIILRLLYKQTAQYRDLMPGFASILKQHTKRPVTP